MFRFYLKYFLIAFLIFLLFPMFFYYFSHPKGVKIEKAENGIKLPISMVLDSRKTINLEFKIPSGYRYIYFPYVECSYIKVHSSGKLIGKYGFNDRNAHSWFIPMLFEIPENIKTLEVEISGVYSIGLDGFYLIDSKERIKYFCLKFLSDNLINISIGLVLTLGILLLMLSKNTTLSRKNAYIYFGLSSIFASIWVFDLVSFEAFWFPMRKLFISFAYFSLLLIIVGFETYNFSKVGKVGKIVAFLNFTAGFLPLLTLSEYQLKVVSTYISPLLMIDALYIVYITFRAYIPLDMLFSSFFAIAVFHDALVMILKVPTRFFSPYGIIAIYLSFASNILFEYKEKSTEVNILYAQSIIDKLTGAYNRGVLNSNFLKKGDVLVFVDLNKFKQINDTLGHDVGDKVLQKLSSIIKSNINSSDLLIRMGGDEFLIVLKSKDENIAEDLIKKIFEEFKNSFEFSPTFSWGISKIEDDNIDNAIRDADDLMYKMKRKK
ncbi:diguanylate cyclase (GGDEF)-like protein [Thermosipho japonicus]|uniref:Diguanylate cyclase (GGDEF)-like protein n=1 Tax=Thermosipho japonicus TaxID=90323 RepID=A0A841GI21_9BACT|nr:GGDEF domain-containing protein [Thermosipho japonicus]MBB6063366.1 diguanylate cyclase (GGDEF)-like protein [Thermosipho japonicus]